MRTSMSSMCTSSMNSTPGTISALPSSFHSATLASICSRTSDLISPVSPANSAKKPCARLLITSISWSVTLCTICIPIVHTRRKVREMCACVCEYCLSLSTMACANS